MLAIVDALKLIFAPVSSCDQPSFLRSARNSSANSRWSVLTPPDMAPTSSQPALTWRARYATQRELTGSAVVTMGPRLGWQDAGSQH